MSGKKFYVRGNRKYSVDKDGRVFGPKKELKVIVSSYATASDELSVSVNRNTDQGSAGSSIIKVKDLVAMTHLPNPNKWEFVNSKDGDRLNVRLSNLEWVATRAETYTKEEAAFAKARNTLKTRGYKTVVHRTADNVLVAMNPQEHYLTSKKTGTLVRDADLDSSLPIFPNGIGVHLTGSEVRILGAERRRKEQDDIKARERKEYQDKIKAMKSSASLITTAPIRRPRPVPSTKSLEDLTHPNGVAKRGFFGREITKRVPTMDAYGRPL